MTRPTLQPKYLGKQLSEDPFQKECLSPLKLGDKRSQFIIGSKPVMASTPQIFRTVSKIIDSNSDTSTVMLGRYRWMGKVGTSPTSGFAREEQKANKIEEMQSMSSSMTSSDETSSVEVRQDRRISDSQPQMPTKSEQNLKYVAQLRRNTLLKNTLLGRILNIQPNHSIEFLNEEFLDAGIHNNEKYKENTEDLIKMAQESDSDDWSQNNEYEDDLDGKSDYSPVEKTNQDIINEFKMNNKNSQPKVSRFSSKEQIECKSHSDSPSIKREELKESLVKLKTIDRKQTPQINEAGRLIEPQNKNIKKTSTNLDISGSKSSETENSIERLKLFNK